MFKFYDKLEIKIQKKDNTEYNLFFNLAVKFA